MKIAIVFDGLGFGGIERVGIDYIKILQDLGYEVDVYNINPNYTDMEKMISNNCHIIHCSFSKFLCPELYSFGVKRWWWGKFAYPIIYLITSFFLVIRKFFRIGRFKNYDLAIAFSGHINDLTFVSSGFIKSEKKMCWLHGGLGEYLLITHGYATLYKKIKNLITLSDYMQDAALLGNKFLSNLNINKIYNPTFIYENVIDVNFVQELQETYGDFFLTVGRFTKQKDQITIIRAMKILKDEFGIDNKLLLVGDGEEKNKAMEVVSDLGMNENIIFIGNRIDVQNFYSASKLFIHSSPAEGLPTVLLEAMNFGIPVVATKSMPGVEEILCNNEFGLECPVGNAKKMAECIYRIITDEELYNHYKSQGYIRVNDFAPKSIANQLKNIILTLI